MIYDVKTKNISFLKVAKLLRDRNVKNNKFMLTLYDDSLVGIDPRSKNLTINQKFAIYRECCRNVWYFIREVVIVPADGTEIPYEANLGNITMTYVKSYNKNMIMILPRQHGKSMGEVIFDIWNLCFATKNANVMYLNKGKNDSIKNLKLFRDIKNLLPEWMLTSFISDPKNDIDNQESKLISKKNNTIKVVAPGADPDSADKQGRGLTTSNIYFDEFAFMKYNEITYKTCQPAYKKASENAKKFNTPYGITITTTPNNLDVPAGAFCYSMIENAAKWTVECFDFSPEQLDDFIEANSQNSFVFIQYSYKELGRDEKWLREMIRQANGDTLTVKREILLEWPRSMESSVFTEDDLDKIHEFVKDSVSRILVDNKWVINFYETPDINLNYILSCDVAGGLSNDNSVINIIHPEDFRIVGDFRSNKIDTDSFKELIKKLMTFYLRNAVLVIERNSYGLPILANLMKNPEVEPRMYRETKEKLGEKVKSDGFTVKRKSNTIAYGVDTNTVTRKQMFDMLPEIVETEYDKFISPNLYKDIASLEKKKNGKIEHSSNGHDDSLMAYLIFRWAVYYGTCFKNMFGIYPTPSRMNVRVVSSSDNIQRIEKVINVANTTADNISAFDGNSMYSQLQEQARKIQGDQETRDKTNQINLFLKAMNFNNDD